MAGDAINGGGGTSQTASFDWGMGLFNLADTGIKAWATVEGAKASADAVKHAPSASIGYVGLTLVALAIVVVIAIKK